MNMYIFPGVLSSGLISSSTPWKQLNNTDLRRGDITSDDFDLPRGTSAAAGCVACEAYCSAHADCAAYVFVRGETPRCAIKGMNDGWCGPFQDAHTISAVKPGQVVKPCAPTPKGRQCTNAQGITAPCGPGNDNCDATKSWLSQGKGTAFHPQDLSCGENDPNAPSYDPKHGVYHLMYQDHVGQGVGGPSFGHMVSRDLIHWARMPVTIWNGPQAYDSLAIYSGSAIEDVEGAGLTLIYPGVCAKGASPDCLFGTTVNLAQPLNASDALSTEWRKMDECNPIAQINASVGPGGGGPPGGGGDSSTAWKTASGEWRFITRNIVNSSVWGNTEGFFTRNKWYEIGPQPGFTQGACPSFFPLPLAADGDRGDHLPTHVYMYSKTTLPHAYSHRSVMVVGTYVDKGPKRVADWTPIPNRAFQIIDNGTYYAAKDFYDPVKKRRIVWGWAQISNGAQALPRVVTWDNTLQRLLFTPLEEQAALRETTTPLTPTMTNVEVPIDGGKHTSGRGVSLGDWPMGDGNQSEIIVRFAIPKEVTATFGVGYMTSTTGVASMEAYVEFVPPFSSSSPWEVNVGIRGTNSSKSEAMSRLTLLPGVDTEIEMRIFTDNVMSEVFWMGGRVALTVGLSATAHTQAGAFLFARADGAGVDAAIVVANKVNAWKVGSMYVTPEEVRNAPRVDAMK